MKLNVILIFVLLSTAVLGQREESMESTLWEAEQFSSYSLEDEITSKRTIDTKFFKVGEKMTSIHSAGPINYFEDNQWKTIFHTIVPSSKGFMNETNAFKTYFPKNASESAAVRLQSGALINDMMDMKFYFSNTAGDQLDVCNIKAKSGKVNFNELTYKQVFGNEVDLRLTQLSTKRKMDYIINDKSFFENVPVGATAIVFEERVEIPSGWSLSLKNNEILLINDLGLLEAVFEKPIVFETVLHEHDENGHHEHDHEHQHEFEGKYELVQVTENSYVIKTITDLSWLLDDHRVFPIYVDPTINCFPDNTAQWTGHLVLGGANSTDYNTNNITQRNNDVMRLGRENASPFRHFNSWAKFNVSNIPDDALICNVRLHYTVYNTFSDGADCVTQVAMNELSNDPVPATNPDLLNDIRTGTNLLTLNYGGNAFGPNGNKITPNLNAVGIVQNAITTTDWVGIGFQYLNGGPHISCYVYIRGYSHNSKPYLIVEYADDPTSQANVGYTGPADGPIPPSPNCTDWSETWCAGSGTYSDIPNIVAGVNYTVENLGTADCGLAMPNGYMQVWAPGTAICGFDPQGNPAQNTISFDAPVSGNYYFNVSSGLCGQPNTCGEFTGQDWVGQSAVLRYRQNTTVTNTTSTNDICANDTKTLTATLGGVHNNPTVSWSITQGNNLGTIAGNTFTAGANPGTVTITATVGFCSESVTFNIIEGPELQNNDFSICSGEDISIDLETIPASSNFTWTTNSNNVSGATNGNGTTIEDQLTTINAGNGSVTYTVTAVNGNCTSTNEVVVTVEENILPTFAPYDNYCAGENIPLIPTTSNEGISGSWSPALNNSQTTTYTFTPSAGQCALETNLTIVITVQATPVFNQIAPICQGDPVITLPSVSNDGISGVWTPAFNNQQTTQYTFIPNDPCYASTTMTVIVNNPPIVNAGNDVVICAGESIILSGTGANNYTWSGGITNGVPFTPPTGTNTYVVTGETNGCTATDQVTVTVQPAINVTFTSDEQEACELLPINFTNTSTGNTINCVWNFGDGSTANGCGTIQHTYAQTGCFDVSLTVTSDAGCVSSGTIQNMVCIKSGPVANFIADPMVVTVSEPTVDFINQSVGADYYEWFFGDGNFSSQVNPSHTYPDAPDEFYEVILVAYNDIDCPDTARAIIEVQDDLIFWVPNAFTPNGNDRNEIFQPVFTSGFDPMNFNLLIFNRWGEVLFESKNAAVGWDGTYGGQIVQDGTYIWKIQFRNKYTDKREMHTGHVILLK